MATTVVDEGLAAAARSAVASLRRAEQAVRESVVALASAGVAGPAGYRSTRRLVEDLLRVDPAEAKRLLAQGHALAEHVSPSGATQEPLLPASARAARGGLVGSAHLRVIAHTMEQLARVPGLQPAVLADAEALLAAQAERLAPAGLARVAARLIATLDPDGVAPDEPGEPQDELLLARRRDGALALSALVHGGADAEMIIEVLDALSASAGPDDPRPLARRRADALLDLVAQALSPTGLAGAGHRESAGDDDPGDDGTPDDDAPDVDGDRHEREGSPGGRSARGPGRALLAVTIDDGWLRTQVGHGLLDADTAISPAEARRLACDAGVVPTVLGRRGETLDVGRLSYTVPDSLRRALHVRDRGCSFPGCTRRPARCHAHHVENWADGGVTALSNLTLLCRYHHHLVHHGEWRIRMIDGRPWYVPPRWIDPGQEPRRGGPEPFREW